MNLEPRTSNLVPGLMDYTDEDMLSELERAIGYTFTDRRLLNEALTHRSFVNETGDRSTKDNERLEFFGDAVIDFFLSDQLIERFPDSREGELTRIRASLVDEESLAQLASRIGLGRYLRLGRGEVKSGGSGKKSILADAYEALVAAVYLDGGAAPVKCMVVDHFAPLMERHAAGKVSRDYKTEFQQIAQGKLGAAPKYVLKETAGPDHERYFTVETFVGEKCLGEGAGWSKKEAEQAAAREGLARLKSTAAGKG